MENFIKAVVPLRQMIHQKRTTAFHAVVPKLASYGGCVCFQGHYTPLSYQRLSLPSPATMSSLYLWSSQPWTPWLVYSLKRPKDQHQHKITAQEKSTEEAADCFCCNSKMSFNLTAQNVTLSGTRWDLLLLSAFHLAVCRPSLQSGGNTAKPQQWQNCQLWCVCDVDFCILARFRLCVCICVWLCV